MSSHSQQIGPSITGDHDRPAKSITNPEDRAFFAWLRVEARCILVLPLWKDFSCAETVDDYQYQPMAGFGTLYSDPARPDMWVGIQKQMFNTTMVFGAMGDQIGISYRYCFETMTDAQVSLMDWYTDGCAGEPTKHGFIKRRSRPLPPLVGLEDFAQAVSVNMDVNAA